MNDYKKTVGAILGALIVVIIGLFFVCSQRPALQDETFSDADLDDSQFRQELMDMLDLADNSGDVQSFDAPSTNESTNESTSDQDILSMLTNDASDTESDVLPSFSPAEASPTSSTTDGVSTDKYDEMKAQISLLDGILYKKSSTVDSLKQIIDRRKSRIAELEQLLKQGNTGGRSYSQNRGTEMVSQSAPAYSAAGTVDDGSFTSRYNAARQQFEARDYNNAIASFEALLGQAGNHHLADNCQYWIGECYFGLKQYSQAALEFQKVFAFQQKDKYDDAQLMIGLAYYRAGDLDKAKYEFEVFLSNYAGSEYANIAERYIARI
jgi:TolA-binding protein